MAKFERLRAADVAVQEARTAEEQVKALVARGALQSDLGLATAGLEDLLRAYVHHKSQTKEPDPRLGQQKLSDLLPVYEKKSPQGPAWLVAQLGEAFRIYARDVSLSKTDPSEVNRFSKHALDCFNNAIAEHRAGDGLAWMEAHCAAVYTMRYWMSLVKNGQGDRKLFEGAENGFEAAISASPNGYVWATRFLAFLYALRGASLEPQGHADYVKQARERLSQVETQDKYDQSSLNRSIAMLYSYDTFLPNLAHDSREASADESISRALQAVEQDPEDFMASYFGAASLWWLARHGKSNAAYRDRLEATLEGAQIRSINALSQAATTLAGIAVMRNDKELAGVAMKLFETIPPDLETRAMMSLDPVFRSEDPDVRERIREFGLEKQLQSFCDKFSIKRQKPAKEKS